MHTIFKFLNKHHNISIIIVMLVFVYLAKLGAQLSTRPQLLVTLICLTGMYIIYKINTFKP